MTGPVESLRYERKFVLQGRPTAQSEAAMMLRLHPALFREVYSERWVNSLYLDSFDHRHFTESQLGISDRVKVRFRWYGSLAPLAENLALEFKIKRNAVGRKERWPLRNACIDEMLSPVATRKLLQDASVPESECLAIDGLRPVLVTRYRRRYYLSACGRFRATVDTELEFLRAVLGSLMGRSVDPATSIIELKYAVEHDGAAREVTSQLKDRMDKSSKYIAGRLRIHG